MLSLTYLLLYSSLCAISFKSAQCAVKRLVFLNDNIRHNLEPTSLRTLKNYMSRAFPRQAFFSSFLRTIFKNRLAAKPRASLFTRRPRRIVQAVSVKYEFHYHRLEYEDQYEAHYKAYDKRLSQHKAIGHLRPVFGGLDIAIG